MNQLGYYFLPVVATKPEWRNIVPSILDEECDLVDLESLETLQVLEDVIFEMYRTLYGTVGVGLAAPQVGIRWQLATIDTRNPEDAKEGRLILINPEIVDTYHDETGVAPESCLSVPFYQGRVLRYEKIRVKNFTLLGEIEYIEAEGFFARVIQHEMAHLKGTLYIDRLESPLNTESGAHVTSHATRSVKKLNVKKLLDERIKELSSENMF